MAKRIVSEDTVQADTRSGTQSVSEAKIYLPNYREVNQILMEAPGSASISFNDVLSRASMQMLQTQERVYQGMERDALMSDVNTKYQIKLEEFNEQNPSGRGFTEYATQTYNQLIQEAADNAQTAEVSQEIRALGYANMKGIANSAVQQENKRFVAYATSEAQKHLEIKYNQIQNDPDRFEGLSAEATATINNLDGVIPASKLAEFREHTKQNLFMSYGMGLVRKNPDQAGDFLKNDLFASNLSHENYNKLINFAEQKKKDKETRDYRRQKLLDNQQNANSKLEEPNVDIGIQTGTVGLADIEANEILTPQAKQNQRRKWYEFNKERLLQQKAYDDMDAIWAVNGDISVIKPKYQQARYADMVRSKTAELAGSSSISGETKLLKYFDKAVMSTMFSAHLPELQTDLENGIRHGSINDKMDAAVAMNFLMSNHPGVLKNVNQKYVNFVKEVTERNIEGANLEEIVKFAETRYLDESKVAEVKDLTKKANLAVSRTRLNKFYDNYFNNGADIVLTNRSQFEKDMNYEIRAASFDGAPQPIDAQRIAAARMKDYWKVVGNKLVRNPPNIVNSTLSEIGIKNKFAIGVRNIIEKLPKDSGVQLTNPIIKEVNHPNDLYNKDLSLNEKPIIGIKIDGNIVERSVEYDSVNQEAGLYKLFVYIDENRLFKQYLPNPDNPFLHAVIDLRPRVA